MRQTIIEPTIDMWTREKRPNNIVINDPKGELLFKFYAPGTVRGFQIVQFNLINSMKTDIYNPLGMAAQAAREGDTTKCATYVENIAEVFFPTDGADDPFWPNAANNAFKRAAYGLIDYYLELERAYRVEVDKKIANGEYVDMKKVEQYIDALWGRVTLFNCYQLFVQLSSKKLPSPMQDFQQKLKAGEFDDLTDAEVEEKAAEAQKLAPLWGSNKELDCLSLYFAATERLPKNSIRNLIGNADNSLKAMGGSEKTIASVYGIAITAMSFFTDPTISTLTSGPPSQTIDLAGYAFPRRMGVRFHTDYVAKNHYVGLQCMWDAFSDENFKHSLGKDFEHKDLVSREGWARYYFDGKFPTDVAYIRLRLVNPGTGMSVATHYFKFVKNYKTTLDGRFIFKDPLLDTKIVKDGLLYELLPVKKKVRNKKTGEIKEKIKYEVGSSTFPFARAMIERDANDPDSYVYEVETAGVNVITQNYVKYSEQPKMTFLVTPPHLMKYAKLILILVKQLVDLNFDQSYLTKSNQKPLYKTRFMLDELGNLQSEGHGISGFQTMLSIGLGQDQQFSATSCVLKRYAA